MSNIACLVLALLAFSYGTTANGDTCLFKENIDLVALKDCLLKIEDGTLESVMKLQTLICHYDKDKVSKDLELLKAFLVELEKALLGVGCPVNLKTEGCTLEELLEATNELVLSVYNIVYREQILVPVVMETECAVLKLLN